MKALYAGSFDPFTFGHLDIAQRARKLFSKLAIGVAINPSKNYTFSLSERTMLIRAVLDNNGLHDVDIVSVTGLVADYASLQGYTYIVKGARTSQDFDYERIIHEVSITQQQSLETVLLFADHKFAHISSSTAKELVKHQGLVQGYVPLHIKHALEVKNQQYIVGVTGVIGSGKSTLCRNMVSLGGGNMHHINLDELAHNLREGDLPLSVQLRTKIQETFGTLDRVALGEIVYNSPIQLQKLNQIYREPLMTVFRQALYGKKGFILVEGAILLELNWGQCVNNNVILIKEPSASTHFERLVARGLQPEQIRKRLQSQYTYATKLDVINACITSDHYGQVFHYDANDNSVMAIPKLVEQLQALTHF